ncbi:molybdopterin synthase [Halorubellus salinus]|uniref:molybdopterin synthase n=1 Tax=Halorubellus salinus TaxID=755309 RepID=UPI001D07FF86|nr:molybdopterin synthase [Halorubellus salinus]
MQVVSVVGASNSGKTTVVEALAERLAERGRVGTVKHLTHAPDVDTDGKDTARHRAAGASETYGLVDDGDWFATGADATLADVLDRLAPRHDYVVVEGYSGSTLPKIALGDRDVADPVLERADSPDALDVDAVVDAIDALEPHHTLSSLVADVESSPRADRAGAIATFTGRVRAKDDPEDVETTHLEFEKYDGVADQRMAAIREALEGREGVLDVRLHHRTGVVDAGEDIVFVVVLAGHRREAFRAVEDGIDRLKDEVPLFKKEVTVDDEFWRHDRP